MPVIEVMRGNDILYINHTEATTEELARALDKLSLENRFLIDEVKYLRKLLLATQNYQFRDFEQN